MNFNLKKQIKNKYFWLSMLSLVILTGQFLGIKLPTGLEEYVNSVLTILVAIGILNNNHTDGLGE